MKETCRKPCKQAWLSYVRTTLGIKYIIDTSTAYLILTKRGSSHPNETVKPHGAYPVYLNPIVLFVRLV